MLERGNTGDAALFTQWLGHAPRPVSQFIEPTQRCLRAHSAALQWLLPLLRYSVAAMWFIAAIVSLGLYPTAESLALLRSIGVSESLAPLLLYGAAGVDFTFGLLTLWPRRGRWLWTAQIAVVVVYTAIISWQLPELWLDPFGPIAKNIPVLAILLLLQQLETRE